MENWMTLEEVANSLKVSKDSIYRLAQRGKMPAYKFGNLWRFRKEEVVKWMENKRNIKESAKKHG
jgi:excisionase family DNA binding protein